jgi:ATP-dependent Clp protease ATP-binding subunit ClpA
VFTTAKERFGLGRIYQDATAVAQSLGDRRVGTEHLLVAMLTDPDAVTARALEMTPEQVRVGLRELDREALAAVGIAGPYSGPPLPPRQRERLRLTPAAKALFKGLRAEAKAEGDRLGVRHVLLLLLELQSPDPAADLLDHLGIDRQQVRDRLQALS